MPECLFGNTRKYGFDLPRPNRKAFEEDTEYLITEFFPSLRPLLKGRMLLLTFDEFDTLAREDIQENFAKPLIAYLRRLMDLEGLNFIFSIGSSGNKLENMQASYTDFFKAALYRKISFLDKKSCRQLIVAPVEGVISYDRRAINKIYLITAGHPYFTQLMCHELFSLCQKTGTREIGQEDVESVVNDVIERGTVNLKFVWDEASDLEKWILAGLAQQTEETSNQKLAQFLREQSVRFVESDLNSGVLHLRDKDVLTKDNSFVVHLMRLWLQKNRPLDRVREELTEINPIANRFIEIGDEYRAREQVEQALDSYRRAVEAAPEYLKAQLSIAMTLFENKEYQEAVQAFEKSLEIDPVDVAAQTGLCDSLLGLGDKALTSEDEEQAIAHYQQILTLNQSHTDARQRLANIHKTQGEELLKSGRDDEALSVLNQALRYTPEDEKLSARYNQILEEKRAKVIAEWLKKTERALERQRWEEAASFVEEALKLDPENQDLQAKRKEVKDAPRQFKLGQYKVKAERALVKENFEKAITAIENAILLAPEDQNLKKWLKSTRSDQLQKQLQIYREQAEKAIANGEWNAAIATRKEALKLSPNDTQLAQELENTKAAKSQAQLDTFKLRAETAIKNKDWETALKAWENAIALAPDDPVWAAKLDETKQAKRKAKLDAFQSQADKAVANEAWEKAIRAIQGAIELAPEDDVWTEKLTAIKTAQRQAQLTAYYTQATEARARGDWATSIAALEDYLSLAPDDANIQNEIEAIREEQRQQKLATFKSKAQTATTEEKWTEAVQAWENYLQLDPEDAVTAEEQLQHARKYAKISSNYVEAEKALRKKNYGRAVNLLQGIIAQDPTYKSTSRLLVEAVEAKGQAPVWQSPWVYGGLGAVVVVVLGILFGPRLIKTIPAMLATDRPTSTNTPDPTAPLDLTTTPMSTPTALLDLTITPMLTPTAPLDLTITPMLTPTHPLSNHPSVPRPH